MLKKRLQENKERIKQINHIFAGAIILIHALEKYESEHASYQFFLIAGIVFISVAIFHHYLEKKIPWVDGVFFIIEGLLSIIVAFDFFHLGKKGLPFAYLFAGFLQFFVAYKFSKKGIEAHKVKHNPGGH